MITMAELSTLWDGIIPQSGQSIGRRVDSNHPLDFFVTYDENNNMQMMLIADRLPKVPVSSQQISVRANSRHDGKYALCYSLSDNSLRDQYISLCWDIMNCSFDATCKDVGVAIAIERFCLWQKLLAETRSKKLSENEIKGLIGELCTLRQVVLEEHSQPDALNSWVGPLGADRDFVMPTGWYEVKTTSLSKDTVSISSLDQLDTDAEGSLLIVRIEKTSINETGSFTLNSLVREIRDSLDDLESRAVFDARIMLAKYDPTDPRAEEPYVFHQIEFYAVDDDFPRIRRSRVSGGISNATYELSIPSLNRWKYR